MIYIFSPHLLIYLFPLGCKDNDVSGTGGGDRLLHRLRPVLDDLIGGVVRLEVGGNLLTDLAHILKLRVLGGQVHVVGVLSREGADVPAAQIGLAARAADHHHNPAAGIVQL